MVVTASRSPAASPKRATGFFDPARRLFFEQSSSEGFMGGTVELLQAPSWHPSCLSEGDGGCDEAGVGGGIVAVGLAIWGLWGNPLHGPPKQLAAWQSNVDPELKLVSERSPLHEVGNDKPKSPFAPARNAVARQRRACLADPSAIVTARAKPHLAISSRCASPSRSAICPRVL